MASKRVIVGIVLVIVGILIFAVGVFAASSGSQSVPDQSTGTAWQLSPNFIGSGAITIKWSGGTTNTTVTLYSCGSSCSGFTSFSSLSQVANATGSSGSFSVTINDGTQYLLAQSGNSALTLNYSILSLGYLSVIGIVIEAVGVILVILPVKPAAAEPEYAAPETTEEAPAEEPAA